MIMEEAPRIKKNISSTFSNYYLEHITIEWNLLEITNFHRYHFLFNESSTYFCSFKQILTNNRVGSKECVRNWFARTPL